MVIIQRLHPDGETSEDIVEVERRVIESLHTVGGELHGSIRAVDLVRLERALQRLHRGDKTWDPFPIEYEIFIEECAGRDDAICNYAGCPYLPRPDTVDDTYSVGICEPHIAEEAHRTYFLRGLPERLRGVLGT